jgi:heat shock protein HslJ
MKLLLIAAASFSILISCNTPKNSVSGKNISSLSGSWQLNYITGPRIDFDALYPDKKPVITFETTKKKVNGNTSCNSFSGVFTVDENKLKFADNFAMTKMACDGEGETVFLQILKKINRFDITGGHILTLMMDDVALMRFSKM